MTLSSSQKKFAWHIKFPTFDFAEVEMCLSDGEVSLEGGNLFPQDQQMFDEEQLTIKGGLLEQFVHVV